MSPLQLFLIRYFEPDPSGTVPLADFIDSYIGGLDGTEDARWRDRAHIMRVIGRTFVVGLGVGNVRCIAGITAKSIGARVPFVAVDGRLVEAAKCRN